MFGPDSLPGIATVIGGVSAAVALSYYRVQAKAATKEHLNNVHQSIFDRLDRPEIRNARHYVYGIDLILDPIGKYVERRPLDNDHLAFEREGWMTVDSEEPRNDDAIKQRRENKRNAELIARTLDQLGYLVREGIVPLNVIARFYSYPTLRCWYQLSPYIARIRADRQQPGHMWEWENLVKKIIRGARTNRGMWEGTLDHDNLKDYADRIEERTGREDFPRDEKWSPPDRTWQI